MFDESNFLQFLNLINEYRIKIIFATAFIWFNFIHYSKKSNLILLSTRPTFCGSVNFTQSNNFKKLQVVLTTDINLPSINLWSWVFIFYIWKRISFYWLPQFFSFVTNINLDKICWWITKSWSWLISLRNVVLTEF